MFLKIFLFEISFQLKKVSTWIYFGVFFLFSYFWILGFGGLIEGFTFGGIGGNIKANSPYVLYVTITMLGHFGLLVIAAVMGSSIYKDFRTGIYPIFFTCPLKKGEFFFGRFFGAMTVVIIVFFSSVLGTLIASFMPFIDNNKIGAFNLLYYIQPYFISVLTMVFFTGAVFFSMSALTKKIISVYASSVIILIGYLIGLDLINSMDNTVIASLIDPIGYNAFKIFTRYWTIAEKNSRLITPEGLFLANRLLWTVIGLMVLMFAYFKFDFSFSDFIYKGKKKAKKQNPAFEQISIRTISERIRLDFALSSKIKHLLGLTWLEFKGIVKNIYFLTIMLAGVLYLFLNAGSIGEEYGTSVNPVTYRVLDITSGLFLLFFLIIITVYAGELVWRERDIKMEQIMDALPVSNSTYYLSKLSALVMIQIFILSLIMISGIIVQISSGYYNFEIILYLRRLFGIDLLSYVYLCILAITIQVLVNNKYLGHFIMVIYYLIFFSMGNFGFEHNLYRLFRNPGMTYSDMNGYGHYVTRFIWFNIYWAALAILFAVVTNLFWIRGVDTAFKSRKRMLRHRINPPIKWISAGALIVFIFAGGCIFYNTNILNGYETRKGREEIKVSYENQYKKYESIPQPRLLASFVNVDIFPKKRSVFIKGSYILKNKTESNINSVHFMLIPEIKVNSVKFEGIEDSVLIDKKIGYHIYNLKKPLRPSEKIRMEYDIEYILKGFKNGIQNNEIVYNGTFFDNVNSNYFPHIGYDPKKELHSNDLRKKYKLKPKETMADVNDIKARKNLPYSNDSDWIDFEAIVSTSKDQIAVAPGRVQREWVEGERRYFHYKTDSKIVNFYSFNSGVYQIKHDLWNDVSIDIFYHKGHEYNIDSMIKSIKRSLDYYTKNFSPYQHKQVKIIEYPRYNDSAFSYPNTIPYSEDAGFIIKVGTKNIDNAFFVTAHEVAHQWWGHQVVGGNVQGIQFITESLAQYSALMVMEKEFGKEIVRRFLRYELDSYLYGRSRERNKELPLYRVEHQGYIFYSKGSLVLYALRDYIGEEALNKTLSKYIKDVGLQGPPYTNSLELLKYIREATPEKYQHIIEDIFETITLYDNKAVSAKVRLLESGQYEVTLLIQSRKLRSDGFGNESEVPINDWIAIGVLGKDGKELYLEKHKICDSEVELRIIVDEEPEKAGIDIYNMLIDRYPDDNIINI